MRTSLLSSDQPFLFAILIGIVSFSVTQITTSLVESPAIEYDLEMGSGADHEVIFTCSITNLSSSSSFMNLKFNFRYKEENSPLLYDPKIIPVPPAGLHDNIEFAVDSALL